MGNGAFENSGHKYAAVMQSRFFTGLYTNRNPLSDPGTPYVYRNYAPRYESLIDGSNVEITNRLTLARRPGLSIYNNSVFPAINSFYSFRQFNANTESIQVVADGDSGVYDATGPSTVTQFFTKTASGGPASFQSVGNVLYFGDGASQKKYQTINGIDTVSNWGVSIGDSGSAVNKTATTGANGGLSVHTWTNPNNVGSTVNFATCAVPSSPSLETTNTLLAQTFGYALPTGAVISGIKVTLEAKIDVAPTSPALMSIQMLKGGVASGVSNHVFFSNTTVQTFTFGGPGYLWTPWTPANINASTFGCVLFVELDPSQARTISVRNVQITVYVSSGPTVAVSGSAGTMSATTGYKYVYAYGTSLTGAISSRTPASASTGAFTNKLEVDITLVASTDSQVDQIHVYRTTDGGSLFFEVPASPYSNASGVVADNAADAELNIEQEAPTQTSNNPPPTGLIDLTYHLGRIWGSASNTVFYSGGPDILTGNGNEAFPPENFFIFPSLVKRMVPTANGIFVFTISDMYFIGGTTNNPANGTLFFSVPFIHGLGLSSWNALDIQGSVIYMLSADGQFLSLDPNSGVSEIGVPIGDKLSAFTSSAAYVAVHNGGSKDKAVYVADGSTGWYRLNPTPAPESGFTWSPFATVAVANGGAKAVQSVEVSPGVRKLLLGPTSSGPILQRDLTVSQDNGISFAASATIGSLVLAQPGGLALLDFITTDSLAIGSHPSVSVLMDEISGSFTGLGNHVSDPSQLVASVTTYGDRYYFAQSKNPAACRHMQIKIDWPAENAANELLSFTLFGTHYNEKG